MSPTQRGLVLPCNATAFSLKFSYLKCDELEGSDTASEATKFEITWVEGSV